MSRRLRVGPHVCQHRPGKRRCFVCGKDMDGDIRCGAAGCGHPLTAHGAARTLSLACTVKACACDQWMPR